MRPVQIIAHQFALQTRLFNNVLEGIDDGRGSDQPSSQVNHLQWIAGHLTNARYHYLSMLGGHQAFPYRALYVDPTKPPPANRALDTSIKYPPLSEMRQLWNAIADDFVAAVARMTEEQSSAGVPFWVPIDDQTMLGFFAFLSSHESHHIGQMSLIRKWIGLEAMSYR